jgi:hypothetical protein
MTYAGRLATGRMTFRWLPVLLLLAGGCQMYDVQQDPKTGELYRHNWWNYYERGMGYAREGRTELARQDFETALGIRSGAKFGYDEDMWRARTYGLHFVESYFPNRELGICLLSLGKPEEAVKHLETSMKQAPSGRAKHYLNLARKEILAKTVVTPPSIAINAASQARWTRARSRTLEGIAQGSGLVQRVLVNGRPLFTELAESRVPFQKTVSLSAGTNVVSVEAVDLLGKKAQQKVTWIADWRPPEFTVRSMRRDGDAWVAEGRCMDDWGLASISVNGVPQLRSTNATPLKAAALKVRFKADQVPLIEAEDLAGNRLRSPIALEDFEKVAMDDAPSALLAEGAAAGEGTDAPKALGAAPAAQDRMKPSLKLGAGSAVAQVFGEEFFLDGVASDNGGLAAILLNGEDQLAKENHGAVRSYFARRLPLDMGTNEFEVVAQDLAGNKITKMLTVVRRPPEYLSEEYRLTMGVPPMISSGQDVLGKTVKRLIEQELLREPVRFRLLEREEGWDYILREQQLSLSDLADPQAALRISKMLPAEMLLMSSVLPEGKGMTVCAKIVDTQEGQILMTSDVYSEQGAEDLSFQVGGLVMKVLQHFPLVSGEVLRTEAGKVTINVGTREGVTEATRFIVLAKTESSKGIQDAKVCKIDGKSVELGVAQIRQDSVTAKILPGAAKDAIKEGYYVYAR